MRHRAPFLAWCVALVVVFWFAAEATLSTTWTSVDCMRTSRGGECVFETATLTSDQRREVPMEQIGGSFVEQREVAWRQHFRLWLGTGIGAVPVTSLNEDPEQVAYVSHRFDKFLEEPAVASFHFEETLPWGTWSHALTAMMLVLFLPIAWRILSLVAAPVAIPVRTRRDSDPLA